MMGVSEWHISTFTDYFVNHLFWSLTYRSGQWNAWAGNPWADLCPCQVVNSLSLQTVLEWLCQNWDRLARIRANRHNFKGRGRMCYSVIRNFFLFHCVSGRGGLLSLSQKICKTNSGWNLWRTALKTVFHLLGSKEVKWTNEECFRLSTLHLISLSPFSFVLSSHEWCYCNKLIDESSLALHKLLGCEGFKQKLRFLEENVFLSVLNY